MKVDINTIKNWFRTGSKPTQTQFWNTWDSFWHKDQRIPISNIDTLESQLSEKADAEAIENHLTDENAHSSLFDKKVDKEEGKQLSDNNFSNQEKDKLEQLQNYNHPQFHQIEDIENLPDILNEKALDSEVVKTVNNVRPDNKGNVNIAVTGNGGLATVYQQNTPLVVPGEPSGPRRTSSTRARTTTALTASEYRVDLDIPIDSNHRIFSCQISYLANVPLDIEMTVESIDDPVNAGRKALRILSIENENGDSFSLSGQMEQFQGVDTILQTKSFNFNGNTPEILIDNIDPATVSSAMRFVNTEESDLTCMNLSSNLEIQTFGSSTVFSNTFTYAEYIDNGNDEVTREGQYTSNTRKRFFAPNNSITTDTNNIIYLNPENLTNFNLIPADERNVNVVVTYFEINES